MIVLLITAVCAITDARWGKVYNAITYPSALAGVGLSFYLAPPSPLMSILGLLVGLAFFGLLRKISGMGAGDVKFFGALGAAVTYRYVFLVLFISVVVAAVLALFRIYFAGAALKTLANTGRLIAWLGRGRFKPHPLLNLTNKSALSVPFGVAIAIASWIFLFMKLR